MQWSLVKVTPRAGGCAAAAGQEKGRKIRRMALKDVQDTEKGSELGWTELRGRWGITRPRIIQGNLRDIFPIWI